MCFSEQASFTTATALAAMSIVCFRTVKDHMRLYALAAIPLFFALQQIAEGVQWLHFKEIWGTSQLATHAKNIYLFFAFAFWPTWVPFAFYLAEQARKRKNLLLALFVGGVILSSYNLWHLYTNPSSGVPLGHSIYYQTSIPLTELWYYALFVISPWFLSTLPHMALAGILYGLSLLVAGYVFETYFISVWCFFAAAITPFLFFALKAARLSSIT